MSMLSKELLPIDEMNDEVFCEEEMTKQTVVLLYSAFGVVGECKCIKECEAPRSKCSCKSKVIFAFQSRQRESRSAH